MKATQTEHPTAEQLRAFALGRLPHVEADEVARHVADCVECCQALRAAPDDSLLGKLREVSPTAETEELGRPRTKVRPTPDPAIEGVPPQLVDHPRYRILARLGEGGMGTVYKAEHRMMERTVALKVISPHLLSNRQAVERFRQEVRAAAKLSHPNIVAAHDADQAGDLHFLVMEFVEGTGLARLVEKRGPLAVAHACSFARQAALGLQHAHEQGMVHRDIKPQNLMVNRRGQLKILDFGLARLVTERDAGGETRGGGKQLTSVDVVVGTPDYLAPEQARASREVDPRADLYSLGGTLYFLLTGRPPFPDGSSVEKLRAHAEREPTPVEQLRPETPSEVAAVVRRLMAKDPKERYQRASDAAQALASFARGASLAVPVEVPTATPMPAAAALTPPSAKAAVAKTQRMRAETPPKGTAKTRGKQAGRPRKWVAAAWVLGLGVLFGLAALGVRQFGAPRDEGKPRTIADDEKKPEPPGGVAETPKKRVLFVLPLKGFYYPDYGPVREILEKNGVGVKVASTSREPARPGQEYPLYPGIREPVKPDLTVSEARAEDFDAVIFVGGQGVDEFLGANPGAADARRIIREMQGAGKPVAAIGRAPATLADAGALNGREATCEWFVKTKLGFKEVTWVDRPVVDDGEFITAQHSKFGPEFAAAVLKRLGR